MSLSQLNLAAVFPGKALAMLELADDSTMGSENLPVTVNLLRWILVNELGLDGRASPLGMHMQKRGFFLLFNRLVKLRVTSQKARAGMQRDGCRNDVVTRRGPV